MTNTTASATWTTSQHVERWARGRAPRVCSGCSETVTAYVYERITTHRNGEVWSYAYWTWCAGCIPGPLAAYA
jgi:hypothetical protein